MVDLIVHGSTLNSFLLIVVQSLLQMFKTPPGTCMAQLIQQVLTAAASVVIVCGKKIFSLSTG